MEEKVVDRCPECQLPKSKDGVYSLTQWISVCSCGLIDELPEQAETIAFCNDCNKRVIKARKGSFTQWIFRSDLCNCENPSVTIQHSSSNVQNTGQIEVFEDESQDEVEIELGQDQFPKDRFKPIGILGEGTSGSVYLCRDRILNKKVALKCLKYFSDQVLVAFQKEAKVNTKLIHPNIAKVIDFGVYLNQKPYMVVEYVPGLSLEHHLEAHGIPDTEIALKILKQIADAIAYAHGQGIFHRDLKSANILYLDDSKVEANVSVIDFGLSQMTASDDNQNKQDAVIGTPGYMAPDTVKGLDYDERSEVYSFGCIAYELLTGRVPFIADSSLEVLNMHASKEVPPLSESRPDRVFTSEVEELVFKCLEKSKEDRYQNLHSVALDIEDILERRSYKVEDDSSKDSSIQKTVNQKLSSLIRLSVFVFVPLAVALFVGSYYYSNFVKNKITHKEVVIESERKLISPKTDMEQKIEHVIVSGKTSFSSKEGFMHPDNVLGFEDKDMKELVGKNYDSISFYGASVSGEGLKYIVDEPIVRLSLDYTGVTDDAFNYINKMSKLKVISCEYTGITDNAIAKLDNLKQLAIFTLNGDRNITDKSVPYFVKQFPDLIKVSFLGTKVTDTGIKQLGALKHLREVYLNNTNITDVSVKEICKPPLEVLLLSNTFITDRSLRYIASCPTLYEIALTDCKMISPEGVIRLKKERPKLKINTKERYDNFSFDLLTKPSN